MREKTLGVIVVLIAFFLGSYNVLARTSFVIQDTDPTTYVVVVLLMVFAMLLFSVKEELRLARGKMNLVYGFLILVAYVLAISYLRSALSFLYYTYRIDALLLPLLLSGIIITVFGIDGIKKLWKQVVYALFASPLLLMPVISANTKFVNSVAYITYWLMNLLREPVTRTGIIITAPSSYSISIASTCADLGAFIAILMFLIPVAYFYNGKLRHKVYWLASGVALFFVFNIARMLTISSVWVYYGIGEAVSIFHLFAGQILFYIAIIVMLVIAGRMKLHLPGGSRQKVSGKHRMAKSYTGKTAAYAIGFAIAIGALGFIFTIPYQNASYYPLESFSYTFTGNTTSLYRAVITPLEGAEMNVSVLGSNNRTVIMAMSNSTFARSNPLYAEATIENGYYYGMISNYSRAISGSSMLLDSGETINSALVLSNGLNMFYVNYFILPSYNFGEGHVINYELFYYTNSSVYTTQYYVPSCIARSGPINGIESMLYNIMKFQPYSDKMLCASLKVGK